MQKIFAMKYQDLDPKTILFLAKSGSHAYGLNTPTSDVDLRGIFVAPKEIFYGLYVPEQASDETNDSTLYELKRFVDLLSKQNPNIVELLGMPEDCVLVRHPLFGKILEHKSKFITRKIRDTFGGYAIAQIGKSRGLNKKIVKPMDKDKKTPMDFCYLLWGNGTALPVSEFLENSGHKQEYCGLAAYSHGKDCYSLFYDYSHDKNYRGISFADSNDVHLTSIPKGQNSIGVMVYNKDAYSIYCREYKEYWEWVEKRNPHRYDKNIEVGKGYDTKNMMHCIRLLRMAEEMLRTGELNVRRPDREYLLDIRNGKFEHADLLEYAENKIKLLDELVPVSPLPAEVDTELLNKLLIEIRDEFYA